MADQRQDYRFGISPTNMREVQNDTKKENQRSWKETTLIAGLTIVAAAYVRQRCTPAWRKFKAEFEALKAHEKAKAKAESARAKANARAKVDSAKARAEEARARAEAKARAEAAGEGASNQESYPGGFQNTMTTKEAALILGIGESSAKDKVKEAHRRGIFKNHPDTGGSAYIASKINQARDMLMK